jgi:hypothetical protein
MVKQHDHVRRYRSGKRARINPGLIDRLDRIKSRNVPLKKDEHTWTNWGKKATVETIEDYIRDESNDPPEFIIQLTNINSKTWHAEMVVGWYHGPEVWHSEVRADTVKEFDSLLSKHLQKIFDNTGFLASPDLRVMFCPDNISGPHECKSLVKYSKQWVEKYFREGGRLLRKPLDDILHEKYAYTGFSLDVPWLTYADFDFNAVERLVSRKSLLRRYIPKEKSLIGPVALRPRLSVAPKIKGLIGHRIEPERPSVSRAAPKPLVDSHRISLLPRKRRNLQLEGPK